MGIREKRDGLLTPSALMVWPALPEPSDDKITSNRENVEPVASLIF